MPTNPAWRNAVLPIADMGGAAIPPTPHHANPAPQVRAVFEHIRRTRMAEVPILNPGVHVDIVGWRAWQGEWLGVLVTPWAINLMLLPGSGGRFRKLAMDERQSWSFPSGTYDFMGGDEEGLGPYQICSLCSKRTSKTTPAGQPDTLAGPDRFFEQHLPPQVGAIP